jgi:hypothetical protein
MSDQMNKRLLAEKANAVLADLTVGGLLLPDQSDMFYEQVIDEPTILGDVRRERLNSNKMQVDKIGFGTRILQKATELVAGTRVVPDLGKVTLDTVEFIAPMMISYRWLESNIEKEDAADRLMSMITRRVSFDLEEALIKADTLSGDTFLAALDGLLKQTVTNVIPGNAAKVSKELFVSMLKKMPDRFKRNLDAMRFYLSHNNDFEYRLQISDRATAGGDAVIASGQPVPAMGVPLRRCSQMPGTEVLLVDPQNVIFGYHREVRIETDRDIELRGWKIVCTLACDFKYEEEPASVKANNLTAA